MKNYFYSYNCTAPADLEELNYIIDNNEEITYNTFRKHINNESFYSLHESLGYSKDFHIKNDWHVTYYKAKYKGITVYMLCHSCIEYVFKSI